MFRLDLKLSTLFNLTLLSEVLALLYIASAAIAGGMPRSYLKTYSPSSRSAAPASPTESAPATSSITTPSAQRNPSERVVSPANPSSSISSPGMSGSSIYRSNRAYSSSGYSYTDRNSTGVQRDQQSRIGVNSGVGHSSTPSGTGYNTQRTYGPFRTYPSGPIRGSVTNPIIVDQGKSRYSFDRPDILDHNKAGHQAVGQPKETHRPKNDTTANNHLWMDDQTKRDHKDVKWPTVFEQPKHNPGRFDHYPNDIKQPEHGLRSFDKPKVIYQTGRGYETTDRSFTSAPQRRDREILNNPNVLRHNPNQHGLYFRPGQTRLQWKQDWDRNCNNWNRYGNWDHNRNWNWNRSSFSLGFYYYPNYKTSFFYGYWGFGSSGSYCTYSPFFYYGMPYVYSPRVIVVDNTPAYSYTSLPNYSYGDGYYLSRGAYGGLRNALDDITNAWVKGQSDLMLRHIDTGMQIAIYLDNNYAYSLSGSDYRDMVRDAIKHIQTISFSIDNVEKRSDGAFTATGTHEFYDANNKHKVVYVSFTLTQRGSKWLIVSAGSSENRQDLYTEAR